MLAILSGGEDVARIVGSEGEEELRIARVFPTRTNMCPTDPNAYFGPPDLFTPKYDEIHISVTFTWDIWKGIMLKNAWEIVCKKVKLGGPALFTGRQARGAFKPGIYLKEGVTITSRGCPNNCPWCFVPKREGKIRELPIAQGNIIQDNNLLACSKQHIAKVFAMLKTQKHIDFSGGLEINRITDNIVQQLRELSIYQMWLAFDHPNMEKPLKKAVNKLKPYFRRDQIRCYVLVGYKDDVLVTAENRLKRVWEIGTLPFAMLYRNENNLKRATEKEWKQLVRQWTRPAIMKSIMR